MSALASKYITAVCVLEKGERKMPSQTHEMLDILTKEGWKEENSISGGRKSVFRFTFHE